MADYTAGNEKLVEALRWIAKGRVEWVFTTSKGGAHVTTIERHPLLTLDDAQAVAKAALKGLGLDV